MIILGIDPGTLVTGYGIIEVKQKCCSAILYDVVKNSSDCSLPIRLKHIYDRLSKIISEYHPDECAIETAFYGKNVQSALKLGHARGAALLAAVHNQIPTTEYSPREVKKSITGNGAASKQQVQFMIKSQLRLREVPKFLDASDALAIALCHSFRRGTSRSLQHDSRGRQKHRSWGEFVQKNPERVLRNI